ncbi:cobalamin biosynthesis protein CbiM [Chlorobaculum limnaeum]|uniref:Cobalamin biosynthesis protein CbiM n=1 Tax=Chlorobaculum limnaeum TaxID=274537 RepID=A0A1D8D271_CHLLM|nr:energy-coupling factor ABC transporter permease [Chlorobaculum limnaeum]AOS84263.1 cobalamin biosynthesis protein CbiM [Chlorobaculum limnaeum]
MHMSDALLSPVVGGAFWAVSAGVIGLSAKKISADSDSSKTVLMGVMGAFVFAAQMINFTIPGTGSSGHIGGGLLLSVLLGPWRAFIALASVLVIQALFFADGGLLALGCNIFNMAFIPAFIAWPFIYRPIAGDGSSPMRLATASIAAAMMGLLTGAFAVVLQTTLSGISDLPFRAFTLFMLPIHAVIGIVEGVLTWGVLSFIASTEPGLLRTANETRAPKTGIVTASLFAAALAIGGTLSWFASSNPDGLEWSISKVTGKEELRSPAEATHELLAGVQERAAFLPDYDFRQSGEEAGNEAAEPSSVNAGTSLSGIAGSLLVLLLAGAAGLMLRKRSPMPGKP